MTQRAKLPPTLEKAGFTTADALIAGLHPRRMRSKDLDQSVRGVRSASSEPDSLLARCAKFQLRMPEHSFFTHTTAARILGLPLPRWEETDVLHVGLPRPQRAPHAEGIKGHQLTIETEEIITVGGLRLTGPIRTWLDLATMLRLEDLVAAGDHMIRRKSPMFTRAELVGAVESLSGTRGLAKLQSAAALIHERSESPAESRLRTLIMLSGLPEPTVNADIRNSYGEFVARADLVIEEYRLVIEYQGDHHRDKKQWRLDMTRRSLIEAERYLVIELNADDLMKPAELIARIGRLAAGRHK